MTEAVDHPEGQGHAVTPQRPLPPATALVPEHLEPIPVIDTGPSFAMDTLLAEERRAHELLELATTPVPSAALRQLDKVSRRWLAKWENEHLAEIDAIAERLERPGAYFLSVNYEWACTCRVAAAPDGRSARLVRVLDWRPAGLGRHLLAARVAGPLRDAHLAGLHRRAHRHGAGTFFGGAQSGADAQGPGLLRA